MHKNMVWIGFLALTAGFVGWITLKTLFLIYTYASLDSETKPEQTKWSVQELKEDRYFIKGSYSYKVDDEVLEGETVFKDDSFRNRYSAEESIKVYQNKDWQVYYFSLKPTISSLQKKFPLKESISSGVLWIILMYFVFLGIYAAKKQN